jgi:general secretion pathway protein G
LAVLVEGSPNAQVPASGKLYFLRRLPRDPFAGPDAAGAEQTWGLRSYESSSDEPRTGRDVYDVFSRAAGNGLNGTPYRQW